MGGGGTTVGGGGGSGGSAGGAGGAGGGGTGGSAGGPPAPFEFADVNHVLVVGQSLANGLLGDPALSGASAEHLMFLGGVCPEDTTGAWLPLEEVGTETPWSGFARLAGELAHSAVFAGHPPPRDRHRLLVSCSAVPNSAYAALKKGTAPYARAIAHVMAGASLAAQAGQTYRVRAVASVHGESDHVEGSVTYAADLAAWQADLDADVRAVTGQAARVPMLHSQMDSWAVFGAETSAIPQAGWLASLADPEGLPLVGPRYFLPHVDGVHLSNEGYRALGEHHAKVYRRVVLEGARWSPLQPRSASRDGDAIIVLFDVPTPPLVLDDSAVSDPGSKGFEVEGAGARLAITAVSLGGVDRVRLDLAQPVPSGPLTVRYAWRAPVGSHGGPASGPRGNLRDSDATTGASGAPLPNWCVHFELPVTP